MNKNVYKVLVPHDFTDVADCAVAHAAKVAKHFNGEVYLLHVVENDKKLKEKREQLESIAEKAEKKYGIPYFAIVRIGNIFEDIGDVASEINAGIIIMGTHGARGIQKIIGSYALKVITNSKVPFIVVQHKHPQENSTYDDIVIPTEFSSVTKQKLAIVTDFAKHFNSKVHIFSPKESDDFLAKKVEREVIFAKNYLDEHGVSYDIKVAEESGNFNKQLIHYASSIDADLIAIVNSQAGALVPGFLGGGDEQEVLANDAEIPVIITNPTQHVVPGGVLGT
ncbi:MAG: hypothetical protein Kow0079_12180 [Vicingaceae bacterium]